MSFDRNLSPYRKAVLLLETIFALLVFACAVALLFIVAAVYHHSALSSPQYVIGAGAVLAEAVRRLRHLRGVP